MNNRPNLITLDYYMAVENIEEFSDCDHFRLVVPVFVVVVIFVIGAVAVNSQLLLESREH